MNYSNFSNYGSEFLDDAIRFADIKDVLVPGGLDHVGYGDHPVLCYPRVELAGDVVGVSPSSSKETANACGLLWIEGVLATRALAALGPLPSSTESTTENGGRVPTDDLTVRDVLGIPNPDPGREGLAAAVVELNGYVHGRECVPLAHAEVEARRLLDSAGFAHWDIEWHPDPDDRRCASFVVDTDAETIQLIPTASPLNQTTVRSPRSSTNDKSRVAVHLTRNTKRLRGAGSPAGKRP